MDSRTRLSPAARTLPRVGNTLARRTRHNLMASRLLKVPPPSNLANHRAARIPMASPKGQVTPAHKAPRQRGTNPARRDPVVPKAPEALTADPVVPVVRKDRAAPTGLRARVGLVVPARLAPAARRRRTIASSGSSLAAA